MPPLDPPPLAVSTGLTLRAAAWCGRGAAAAAAVGWLLPKALARPRSQSSVQEDLLSRSLSWVRSITSSLAAAGTAAAAAAGAAAAAAGGSSPSSSPSSFSVSPTPSLPGDAPAFCSRAARCGVKPIAITARSAASRSQCREPTTAAAGAGEAAAVAAPDAAALLSDARDRLGCTVLSSSDGALAELSPSAVEPGVEIGDAAGEIPSSCVA